MSIAGTTPPAHMVSIIIMLTLSILSPQITKTAPILTLLIVVSRLSLTKTHTIREITTSMLLDPLANSLVILTLWITTLIILRTWEVLIAQVSILIFIRVTLTLRLVLVTAFTTNNLIIFYIIFETSLIPTLIIILIWGYQPERLNARIYIIIYTISRSLPLLLSITSLIKQTPHIISTPSPLITISWINKYAILLAFMVKLPIYSLHLWLPKAHTEAPVAGSIILARVLLKLGSYGAIRLTHLFPNSIHPINTPLITLRILGATSTAVLCVRQHDIKQIVAYASVSHIRLVIAALASQSHWATSGVVIINIRHGLTRSLLFLVTNILYTNSHTRALVLIKGLQNLAPIIALPLLIALLANGGAPPFIGLLREIIISMTILSVSLATLPIIFTISFISIIYSIFVFINVSHGKPSSFKIFYNTNPLQALIIYLHITPLLIIIIIAQYFRL